MSQPETIVSSPSSPISSGPMSAGMISLNTAQTRNDSTEHICMFSVCLMFIGVPIIVVGIIFLSFLTPFGVILMVIGAVASFSGAILAILSAIMSLFNKGPDLGPNPSNYITNETPDIPTDGTLYTDLFSENVNNETPQQLNASKLQNSKSLDSEKLDPNEWKNFPNAQNPKAYLNSFGDLPKVLSSPIPSNFLDLKDNSVNQKKYEKKNKKKLPKIKMHVKKKSISKTQLTNSFDDIHTTSTSSSTTSSPINEPTISSIINKDSKIHFNNSNKAIITIENFDINLYDSKCDTDVVEETDTNLVNSIVENNISNNQNSIANDESEDIYPEEYKKIFTNKLETPVESQDSNATKI